MHFRYPIIGIALLVSGYSTAALAKSDATFLSDAIQINLAEISVGDLAQKNGGSDDVKAFGKMLQERDKKSKVKG